MTAVGRAGPEHGDPASTGGQRTKSNAGNIGNRGRKSAGDPTFGMSSRAGGDERNNNRALSPSSSTGKKGGDRALSGRSHKSSDRLQRLGAGHGSSTHLANKRSKSYTQVSQAAGAGEGRSGRNKKQGRASKDTSQDKPQQAVEEEGWTSASASGTPEQSTPASPVESNDDGDNDADEQDQGLVMGLKRKSNQDPEPNRVEHVPSSIGEAADAPETNASISAASQSSLATSSHQQFPRLPVSEPSLQPPEARTTSAMSSPSSSLTPHLSQHSRTASDDTLGKNSNPEAPRTPEASAESTSRDHLTELRKPTPLRTSRHERMNSSASGKTLTGSQAAFDVGSPVSISSRQSLRSRTLSLKPRDPSLAAAPPMLSTENAMGNGLTSGVDENYSSSPLTLSRRHSRHEIEGSETWPTSGHQQSGRRNRQVSGGSDVSSATLPNLNREAGPSNQQGGLTRIPSSSTESALFADHVSKDRKRTQSIQSNTNSLTTADAAKLAAKLRQARDAMDEQQQHHPQHHSNTGGGLTSRVALLANATAGDVKFQKPVISTFSKDQERIGKPVAKAVTSNSVYSENFTRAHRSEKEEQGSGSSTLSKYTDTAPKYIRYVARFGLSGPRIVKSSLNEALLAPSFDGDEFEASWAPALANAAGLGSRSSRFGTMASTMGNSVSSSTGPGLTSEAMEDGIPLHDPAMAFTGSAAVNGPNATPVHLIHGLTSISSEPFPLDPADTPSLEFHEHTSTHPLTADPETLRAIALTSQMLSTHRSHTITRRYYDPIRESIERCTRSSTSTKRLLSPGNPNHNNASASLSPAGSAGSAASSLRRGPMQRQSSHLNKSTSFFDSETQSNTAANETAKGTKRVWSGRSMSRADSASGSGR
ncbi:unnamed protein product [Sympodiomycopsis kandeliae]